MTFEDWIDEIGINRLAKKLKISPMTVYYWRQGRNDPGVDFMRRMVRLAKGKIKYSDIIDRPVRMSRVPFRGR